MDWQIKGLLKWHFSHEVVSTLILNESSNWIQYSIA